MLLVYLSNTLIIRELSFISYSLKLAYIVVSVKVGHMPVIASLGR